MSQHCYQSTYQGQPITILMGWDRPLQGFFMVIHEEEKEDYVYTNLEDPTLFSCSGFPHSLDHFQQKLIELRLSVPALMIQEIKKDAVANMGNRYVIYEHDGSVRA